MWAVCAGNEDVVSYLLQREVDRKEAVSVCFYFKFRTTGQQRLHSSSFSGYDQPGKHVQNACPTRLESVGTTVLSLICSVIQERDQQNNTPMHLAAGRGHAEVVRSLVTEGANMSDKDTMGRLEMMQQNLFS